MDVDVLAIYPHAHYLGKDVKALRRTCPTAHGSALVWIRDWDFNWQAVYRYARPVPSAPGAPTVHMRDHLRQLRGQRAQPEPAAAAGAGREPVHGRDGPRLAAGAAAARPRTRLGPAGDLHAAEAGEVPRATSWPTPTWAPSLEERGRPDEAHRALPGGAAGPPGQRRRCSTTWARCCSRSGAKDESARSATGRPCASQPDYASARYNLGNALAARGAFAEAITHFREVVRVRPDDAARPQQPGRRPAGHGPGRRGRSAQFNRVAGRGARRRLNAHYNLGAGLGGARDDLAGAAARTWRQAVRLDPGDVDAQAPRKSLRADAGAAAPQRPRLKKNGGPVVLRRPAPMPAGRTRPAARRISELEPQRELQVPLRGSWRRCR